jgi:lipopolysaccharide transport system permease protein
VNPSETQGAAIPETLIAPPRSWSWPISAELWEYRDLIYFLTKRELQIRYKQSFFGVSWAVMQPLALAVIFALIIGGLFNAPSDGLPYLVFAFAGVVPWLFTAQSITMGANSLVEDSDLISKVYFPRLALPLAKALSLLLDLVISFALVIVVALIAGVGIQPTVLLVPLFALLGVATTFALSSFLAAVNVKYRDVQLVMPMVVQILFFATPVIYPSSLLSQPMRYVVAVNPLSSVLDGIRWAMFGTAYPGTGIIAISVGSALVLMTIALSYFNQTERYFADIV